MISSNSVYVIYCQIWQFSYWNHRVDWCPDALFNWGRVTHIYDGNRNIIDSDSGLSPGQHQAIIYTNADILLIGPLGTDFSEIVLLIYTFSFKKIHFVYEMAAILSRPPCVHQMFTNNVTVLLYKVNLVVCAYNFPNNIKCLLWFLFSFVFVLPMHDTI